jgi:hypothetical protein
MAASTSGSYFKANVKYVIGAALCEDSAIRVIISILTSMDTLIFFVVCIGTTRVSRPPTI